MAVLLLDNHDSFTYNLVQLIEEAGCQDYQVSHSERVDVELAANFSHIMFSPGPGLPKDFPAMQILLRAYAHQKAILGICLGHQAIAEFYGAQLYNLPQVVHGQQIEVQQNNNETLFSHLPSCFQVGLYHSWAVDKASLPPDLEITAATKTGRIMAVSHKTHNVKGVQFHPESIMTPLGLQMIKNFLNLF